MITVQEVLDKKGKDIWSIHPQATVYEALQFLADKNIGAILVTEEEKVVGIFSERDYAREIILKGKSSKDTPVSELMTREVITVRPDDSLDNCMKMITDKRIRHLPVISDEKLVGILTIGDVVKHIISLQKDTIQGLEDYISAR